MEPGGRSGLHILGIELGTPIPRNHKIQVLAGMEGRNSDGVTAKSSGT